MLCIIYIGHHYPTPKQLRNILKPDTSGLAVRWHDLGTELLTNDTIGTLDVIKADHPNDVSACCNKMFVKWLELQPSATWSQLIAALSNIGMKTVAESVIECLLKGILHVKFEYMSILLMHFHFIYLVLFMYVASYKYI